MINHFPLLLHLFGLLFLSFLIPWNVQEIFIFLVLLDTGNIPKIMYYAQLAQEQAITDDLKSGGDARRPLHA